MPKTVSEPRDAVWAKRLVEEAVVAKKVVEVPKPRVELLAVRFVVEAVVK